MATNMTSTLGTQMYENATEAAMGDVTAGFSTDITPDMEWEELYELMLLITYITDIYVNIPIAVVGSLCNTIVAIILFPRAKKLSAYNYMFVIAILDTVYLLICSVGNVLHVLFNINILLIVPCSITYFLNFAVSELSSWILVLCCCERALVMYFPHRAKIWFKPKRAYIAMGAALLLILMCNWYIFGGIENVRDQTTIVYYVQDSCVGRNDVVNNYIKLIFPWVDLFAYSLIPGLVLIIVNGAIIAKFMLAKRATGFGSETSHALMKHGKKISEIAVALAAMFIVTTTPITAIWSAFQVNLMQNGDPLLNLKLAAIYPIFRSFGMFNHCANLFVYAVFGKMLRDDLKNLFSSCLCCRRLKEKSKDSFSSSQMSYPNLDTDVSVTI